MDERHAQIAKILQRLDRVTMFIRKVAVRMGFTLRSIV